MTAHIHIHRDGDVALIRLENPPVNGLGFELRQGLDEALHAAEADTSVRAVVIYGGGKMFCGGADIRQFNTPKAGAEPTLRSLATRLAASTKPVVAAIHGMALGGGLELALACHYRVATKVSQLGLPEVKLGLLPGGGGTQRLPRLVGAVQALRMIVTGEPVGAEAGLTCGLLDAVVDGELLAQATAFARDKAGAALPLVSRMVARNDGAATLFDDERVRLRQAKPGFTAPQECINCVEQAMVLDFEAGLDYERERFGVLVQGPESKALRHLFFAEREAAKLDDLPAGTQPRPIHHVGVIGAGTMGVGIAMSLANAGLRVTLLEMRQAALDRGLGMIRDNYAATAAKGKLSAAELERRVGLIQGTLSYDALSDVDLVIEAVFEEMSVKHEVFERLDRVCKPGAILATNTSRLDIDQIAAVVSRPQDVIGLHFFSPANMMRLLEVVRGAKSAPDVIMTAMRLGQQIKKLPVLVGNCDGFVGNRMVLPQAIEAEFLLEEGATPEQVDAALKDCGMAMGRFAVADLAGLDIGWTIRKRMAETRKPGTRSSRILERVCALGRFGQKTGAGFYRYEAGSRTPLPDPVVHGLIDECSLAAGIPRREISDAEIVERNVYALVNEGARLLAEGIARRASDIDLIYVNGYGFPPFRGGPMFYADTVGLDKVYARIREFHQEHGDQWEPAPLLAQLAASGGRFQDLGDSQASTQ
ncbi:FAD-dependent oxidoreductase [Comamonas sp. lk]|uniref:FAD-dependent oxidoreductase n=1 Tax=Comamonas sp. lk TaxID=2201272 RepID=UPI000EB1905E|nr:FAD-dependent oxidoreductase [Comamonas sp. lk]